MSCEVTGFTESERLLACVCSLSPVQGWNLGCARRDKQQPHCEYLTSRDVWNVLPELAPLRGKVRRSLAASLEPIVTTPDHLNVQLAS